ncbi:MAG: MmgE/PrpD family protein [Deltaproteobacteria bacterium]|nr:MmgE/PrpD family protein [Deltaproteobacteria bacterium]
MEAEKKLSQFVTDTRYDSLPRDAVQEIKNVVLNICGTVVAGSTREGCRSLVDQVRDWGGKEEATILIHGGKVPAYNAAFANAYMARALDIDDAMFPGMHVGASTVSAALAAAELTGGCSGQEFLTALTLGHEIAARFNAVTEYVGFDPTGVCTIFGTATAAGRILGLNPDQMLNTLALAFNKSGGSFQANVDGSLAVRAIQGFAAQGGIISAQLAKQGINGPKQFVEGVYGYLHLYGRDAHTAEDVTGKLGDYFTFPGNLLFKKHPSCACTEAGTDAILYLIEENGLTPENVDRIDIKVSPIAYNLVGHPFEIGDTPTVNAQFNVRYCVASALLRKGSRLQYFEESQIRDPRITELLDKIHIILDKDLEGVMPLHLKADMTVSTTKGDVYQKAVDYPRGAPGNPMNEEEFRACFRDYVSYGPKALPAERVEKIIDLVNRLEEVEDVRALVPLLLV